MMNGPPLAIKCLNRDPLQHAGISRRALDALVRQRKVLYVGISDAPTWWVWQANMPAYFRGWSWFVGLQVEYSLIERTVEREIVPMARALNVGFTAWSPLCGGVLSGKYHGHNSSLKQVPAD
jgi:aryl-alcohol dehydrogenase-like predicted oxidoreductase